MEFFVFIPGWNLSYDYMEKNDVSSWDESFHLVLLHIKLFLKISRGLELVFLPHFLHNIWRRVFLMLYSID